MIKHLAIIMDGNRRYAREHSLKISEGHKKGAETLKKICDFCQKIGIKYLTVYALSTENLMNRTKAELAIHFALHKKYIKEWVLDSDRFVKEKIRFNVLGKIDKLPEDEQEIINEAMERTKNFSNFVFNICLVYNGQDEIINAVKEIIDKKIKPEEITRDVIKENLYTKDIPAPELIIRTGMENEKRLSGFLLWDSSYSEFEFTNTYWPEFSEEELIKILENFEKRERRFGK